MKKEITNRTNNELNMELILSLLNMTKGILVDYYNQKLTPDLIDKIANDLGESMGWYLHKQIV